MTSLPPVHLDSSKLRIAMINSIAKEIQATVYDIVNSTDPNRRDPCNTALFEPAAVKLLKLSSDLNSLITAHTVKITCFNAVDDDEDA